jgi:hypothetical protein
MSKTGEFFASIMMDPKFDANDTNKSRWLRVGNGAYLILRSFTMKESNLIDEGLKDPTTFRFGDTGNLMFEANHERHEYGNPTDVTVEKDFDTRSLQTLREDVGRHYNYDSDKVISRNLRYILYKNETMWYLLYNAIHSREFANYYRYAIENATNVSWGATTMKNDKHINLNRVFNHYCDAFIVTHKGGAYDGKKSYLDPVCNMIKSEHQAQRTALFDTALVCPKDPVDKDNCEYDVDQVKAAAPVLSQLGSGNDDNGNPKYCLCMGGVHNFIDELESHDFIHDFEGRRNCSNHNLELNFCSIMNKAETLNINGSEMVAECGGNVGAGAGTVGDSGLTETVVDDEEEETTGVDPIVSEDIKPSSPTLLEIAIVSLALGGIAYVLAKSMLKKPKTEKKAPRE